MENFTESDNESPLSCEQYKATLTAGLEPYQVLSFTVPKNTTVWAERSGAWMITFNVYTAVSTLIFLLLGILSVMMLIKKDCLRLPTKTFFAIYFTTAIFGFSRALCLILDPYGLFGYIAGSFPAWFIVSRMLAALGFPSLVASTTLMIFTLLKVAKAQPGKQWYHYWKFIIPIILVPYIIAFFAEFIGNFSPYPALLIIVVCEILFALWGLVMCAGFLFAGNRLLHQMQTRGRKTIRISAIGKPSNRRDTEAQMATRHQFALQEHQRHHARTRRTTRKIVIITYGTALFTIAYSFIAIAGAIMNTILLFDLCLGFGGRGPPSLWLAFEVSKRVNETVLVVVLLYSITDMAGMMKVICGKCCKKGVEQCEAADREAQSNVPNRLCQGTSQISILSVSTPGRQGRAAVRVGENLEEEDFTLNASNESARNDTSNSQDLGDVIEASVDDRESRHPENPSQYHLMTHVQSQSNSPIHTESVNSNTSNSTGNHTASVDHSVAEITALESPCEIESSSKPSTSHGQERVNQRTVSIQTDDTTDCPCQVESNLQGNAQSSKPTPRPRKLRPKKSRNQFLNEQQIEALRQLSSHHATSTSQNHIFRKQTI